MKNMEQDWGGQPMRDYLKLRRFCKEPDMNGSRMGAVGAKLRQFLSDHLAEFTKIDSKHL